MVKQLRFVLFIVVVAALAGCGPGFVNNEVVSVDAAEVVSTMQYVDGPETGPAYTVSMVMPDEWVGEFAARNLGNVIYLDYVGDGDAAAIFSVEALSPAQYWKASGSYPAYQTNLVNRGDTFFVYTLPVDAHYSGLSEEEFTAFAEMVPSVVETFSAEPVE